MRFPECLTKKQSFPLRSWNPSTCKQAGPPALAVGPLGHQETIAALPSRQRQLGSSPAFRPSCRPPAALLSVCFITKPALLTYEHRVLWSPARVVRLLSCHFERNVKGGVPATGSPFANQMNSKQKQRQSHSLRAAVPSSLALLPEEARRMRGHRVWEALSPQIRDAVLGSAMSPQYSCLPRAVECDLILK